MARGKGGLGRGLDSLFEDAAPVFESEHAAVETLPLREIEPDPDQPRKTFEQETLSELAASIAEHGLLQPIAVRPRPMGGYSIVAGERRWRASRMAGLTEVPVVIKDVSDEQYTADNIIIATGSDSKCPPIEGTTLPGVVTSTELLDIDHLPKRLRYIRLLLDQWTADFHNEHVVKRFEIAYMNEGLPKQTVQISVDDRSDDCTLEISHGSEPLCRTRIVFDNR